MTTQQINNRLQEILTSIGLTITSLTDQANFNVDLGLDSLDVTDLLIQVEFNFGIRIPDEDWFKLQTIGQLKDYLADELLFGSNGSSPAGATLSGNEYTTSL